MDQIRILEEERDALRRQIRIICEENESLKWDDMREKILNLKPLVVPKRGSRGG